MSSLIEYLDKVRAKPERERRRLAFVWTVLLTLFIVGLWLVNLQVTHTWTFFAPAASSSIRADSRWSEVKQSWYDVSAQIAEGWTVMLNKFGK